MWGAFAVGGIIGVAIAVVVAWRQGYFGDGS